MPIKSIVCLWTTSKPIKPKHSGGWILQLADIQIHSVLF